MRMDLAAAAVSPATNTINGQGWRQLSELGLALLLSALIGLERELRHKDAGLRTHTLVGVGAALFMLISKYGFTDVLERQIVVLDPSRMAAQIVSGIGFLGAGLIFVHRGSVRGLTTAASIWVTAAIGSAAGAGLPILAAVSAGIYFFVTLAFPLARRRLPSAGTRTMALRVSYPDGRGILRRVLNEATGRGFTIEDLATEPDSKSSTSSLRGRPGDGSGDGPAAIRREGDPPRMVTVTMHVHGKQPVGELASALSELDYVDAVVARDIDDVDE